jgi:hypothetical protein
MLGLCYRFEFDVGFWKFQSLELDLRLGTSMGLVFRVGSSIVCSLLLARTEFVLELDRLGDRGLHSPRRPLVDFGLLRGFPWHDPKNEQTRYHHATGYSSA